MRAARGERFQNVRRRLGHAPPGGARSPSRRTRVPLGGVGDVALVTFEDVTELEAARRRAALLAEAGAQLGALARLRARSPHAVARARGARAFADWCVRRARSSPTAASCARRSRRPTRPSARSRERLRPAVPARPGRPSRLAAGDPHGRAAARSPRSRRVRRSSPRPMPSSARCCARIGLRSTHDRAAACPRPRDRRPRARDGRVGAPLRRGGPGARPAARRPLRARARQRAPVHRAREAVAGARRAGEEVNTILGGVADAVTAQAPDGALVYANDAAVRMVGLRQRRGAARRAARRGGGRASR